MGGCLPYAVIFSPFRSEVEYIPRQSVRSPEDSENVGHSGMCLAMPSSQVQAGTNGIHSAHYVTTWSQCNGQQHGEAYGQEFDYVWKMFEIVLSQIAEQSDVSMAI